MLTPDEIQVLSRIPVPVRIALDESPCRGDVSYSAGLKIHRKGNQWVISEKGKVLVRTDRLIPD